MEDGNLIPWAQRSARVGLRVNWSFSGEGWPGWLPSAMSCTGRGTTNWSGRFRFMRAAIRLMGWRTASRTGSIPNSERGGEMKNFAAGSGKKQVPPLRFASVGMTDCGWRRGRPRLHLHGYLGRARTRVTSSGCSSAPIQSSTAAVTISLMRGSGNSRFSRNRSIRRCSPNSPKSFSGSVTPSV